MILLSSCNWGFGISFWCTLPPIDASKKCSYSGLQIWANTALVLWPRSSLQSKELIGLKRRVHLKPKRLPQVYLASGTGRVARVADVCNSWPEEWARVSVYKSIDRAGWCGWRNACALGLLPCMSETDGRKKRCGWEARDTAYFPCPTRFQHGTPCQF